MPDSPPSADLRLVALTNKDPEFYQLLGPFLARRQVVREVGAPLWDDDGKTWVALVDDDGKVAGFAAMTPAKGIMRFGSAYVLPAWRRSGVHRRMVAERLKACEGSPVTATCNDATLPDYLAEGFSVVRERGRWKEVRRA